MIWRSAVEATHDFLTSNDIDNYESRFASEYFPIVTDLTIAVINGISVGFSGVADGILEMLFVDQQHQGLGAGSVLLSAALAKDQHLKLDVNEQNPRAVDFYRRHGFVTTGRSATDSDGRPFPILHMIRP